MNRSATQTPDHLQPLASNGGETSCHPRFKHLLSIIYIFALHALLAWTIWDPSLISRIEKFARKSPEYQPEYKGAVQSHTTITNSLSEGATVLLGDSRMRDLDASAIASGSIYNLSIGGDTTRGLKSRLSRYSHLDRCKLVILGIGVNDLSHYSNEESIANYEEILLALQSNGVQQIAVCSVLPVNEEIYRQANSAWLRGHRTNNLRINTYNSLLSKLCNQFTPILFIDTTSSLIDSSGNLRREFTTDGLHLTPPGNSAWATAIERSLLQKNKTK